MKKPALLSLILLAFLGLTNAQNPEISGSWLLTKVEIDGEIEYPYFVSEFQESGALVMMGIEIGTWEFNKKSNVIVIESPIFEELNGEMLVLNLTEKELVAIQDGAKQFYKRLDQSVIEAGNKNSGLFGTWELKDHPTPGINTLLTFKEPDIMTILEKSEGYEGKTSGTWIFDGQEMTLLMIGHIGEESFNGENKVLSIDQEMLSLENNGRVFNVKRKMSDPGKIEKLTFSEEDFFDNDGEYKYGDEASKLPWANWSEMKTDLVEVKQLVYSYSSLIEGTETFNSKILTANVEASIEEEGYEIDFIFYGYDSYNPPDDAQIPPNPDYYNELYPLQDESFRVVGNEQITTPAGSFDCTVIEVVNYNGLKKKLWMINDRLGIYAKIIEEDPDENFGHYVIYELTEIK